MFLTGRCGDASTSYLLHIYTVTVEQGNAFGSATENSKVDFNARKKYERKAWRQIGLPL